MVAGCLWRHIGFGGILSGWHIVRVAYCLWWHIVSGGILSLVAYCLWWHIDSGGILSGWHIVSGRIVSRGVFSQVAGCLQVAYCLGAYCLGAYCLRWHIVWVAYCLGAYCPGACCLGACRLGASCPSTLFSKCRYLISFNFMFKIGSVNPLNEIRYLIKFIKLSNNHSLSVEYFPHVNNFISNSGFKLNLESSSILRASQL